MEKQENIKRKEKYNNISLFLVKFIFEENFDMLKNLGFIDSYTNDLAIEDILRTITSKTKDKLLILLFKNLKNLDLTEVTESLLKLSKKNIKIITKYELLDNKSIVVISFPEEFKSDYDLIIKGHYSKLSYDFKKVFPITKEVFNSEGKRIGKEYSIYYQIFNRTEWLINFWKERLNLMEIDKSLELWEKPKEDEINFDSRKNNNK